MDTNKCLKRNGVYIVGPFGGHIVLHNGDFTWNFAKPECVAFKISSFHLSPFGKENKEKILCF